MSGDAAGVPGASLRACLSAISKIWKCTGPQFTLKECGSNREMKEGDFLITVIFHVKETKADKGAQVENKLDESATGDESKGVEESEDEDSMWVQREPEKETKVEEERPAPPELCASFVVSVVDKMKPVELMSFDEKNNVEEATLPTCFELFCNGNGDAYEWAFLSDDYNPLKTLKVISATTFRHEYTDLDPKWKRDPKQTLERCWILTSIDMPFPDGLICSNLDYLANFLLIGLVVYEAVCGDATLTDCIESRGLCSAVVEEAQLAKLLKPLRIEKRSTEDLLHHVSKLHHLVRVGHLGILIETSFVVGGAAYDAIYDPKNLAKNAEKRGKLATAATAGGIIGGAIGVVIPIPGLFILFSVAGSMTGRWIAGKFITDDGKEVENMVPVGGLRCENDEDKVVALVQDFEEDVPPWQQMWSTIKSKAGVKKEPPKQAPLDPQLPPKGGSGSVLETLVFNSTAELEEAKKAEEERQQQQEQQVVKPPPPSKAPTIEVHELGEDVSAAEKGEGWSFFEGVVAPTTPPTQQKAVVDDAAAKKPSGTWSSWFPGGGGASDKKPGETSASAPALAGNAKRDSGAAAAATTTTPNAQGASAPNAAATASWSLFGRFGSGTGAPTNAPPQGNVAEAKKDQQQQQQQQPPQQQQGAAAGAAAWGTSIWNKIVRPTNAAPIPGSSAASVVPPSAPPQEKPVLQFEVPKSAGRPPSSVSPLPDDLFVAQSPQTLHETRQHGSENLLDFTSDPPVPPAPLSAPARVDLLGGGGSSDLLGFDAPISSASRSSDLLQLDAPMSAPTKADLLQLDAPQQKKMSSQVDLLQLDVPSQSSPTTSLFPDLLFASSSSSSSSFPSQQQQPKQQQQPQQQQKSPQDLLFF